MKEHIIPYVLKNAEWWSGLNLTNYGFAPTSVLIEYHNDNGTIAKTEEIALNGGCMKRFAVDVPYGWARAITSDDVIISEFMGDAKSSFIAPVDRRDLAIRNLVQPNRIPTTIQTGQFTQDCATSKFLTTEYFGIIELLARATYLKYPARQARKTEIVDACAEAGETPGHPPQSHINGTSADFHYFTLGATNHTQANPDGQGIVQIWENGKLNAMFDTDRNMDFYLMYLRCFPRAVIYIDKRIKTAMEAAANRKYGVQAQAIIQAGITADESEQYNHHLHAHCCYGDAINWGATL